MKVFSTWQLTAWLSVVMSTEKLWFGRSIVGVAPMQSTSVIAQVPAPEAGGSCSVTV